MKLTSVQRGCVISDFWALQRTRPYIEVFKDDSCVFHCVFQYPEETYRRTPCFLFHTGGTQSGMPLVNLLCYMYMVKTQQVAAKFASTMQKVTKCPNSSCLMADLDFCGESL